MRRGLVRIRPYEYKFGVSIGINAYSEKVVMSEDPEPKPSLRNHNTGAGIGVGAAAGVALGAAFGQLALGLALGAALGAAVDIVSHVRYKNTNRTS